MGEFRNNILLMFFFFFHLYSTVSLNIIYLTYIKIYKTKCIILYYRKIIFQLNNQNFLYSIFYLFIIQFIFFRIYL